MITKMTNNYKNQKYNVFLKIIINKTKYSNNSPSTSLFLTTDIIN